RVDAQQVELHVGRVRDDAAAEPLAGPRCGGQERRDGAARERLGGADRPPALVDRLREVARELLGGVGLGLDGVVQIRHAASLPSRRRCRAPSRYAAQRSTAVPSGRTISTATTSARLSAVAPGTVSVRPGAAVHVATRSSRPDASRTTSAYSAPCPYGES